MVLSPLSTLSCGSSSASKKTALKLDFANFSPISLLLPGVICYASYYLILLAYQYGGEVAAVTSVRQASIPISVALGGLYLREGAIARRFLATGILTLGIILIVQIG